MIILSRFTFLDKMFLLSVSRQIGLFFIIGDHIQLYTRIMQLTGCTAVVARTSVTYFMESVNEFCSA